MALESPSENLFGGDVTTNNQSLTGDGPQISPIIGDTLLGVGGGGGGGTTLTGTTSDTPIGVWVPTTGNEGTLNISLKSSEPARFLENSTDVGIGSAVKLTYSPSLTFGNSKTYTAEVEGKRATNYFIVSVKSTQSITGRFLASDQLFVEEYAYDKSSSNYVLANVKELETTTGTIDLQFSFEAKTRPILTLNPEPDPPISTPQDDTTVGYEIAFATNLTSEIGDTISLKYKLSNNTNDIIDEGVISLSEGSTDGKQIKKSLLDNGYVIFEINGMLPKNTSYSGIYWANKTIAEANINDFTKWNKTNEAFKISAQELLNGVVVFAQLEKLVPSERPKITAIRDRYDIEVKESDKEKVVFVEFATQNADYVNAYISADKFIKVDAKSGGVDLFFIKDFLEVYGLKKVILVAESEAYGTGDRIEIMLNFISINDFPSITQIVFPNEIDIPSFSDYNISYDITYNTFAATHINVELLQKDKTKTVLFKNLPPNNFFKINLRDLANKFQNWNGSDNVTLILTPLNTGGPEELVGNSYEITTKLIIPSIKLDEDSIRKSIFDAFVDTITFSQPQLESKYLTHLANFGNDEQILISSWEDDNWTLSDKKEDEFGNITITKEVKATILKLYSPLPPNVADNSTFWITKLMANPLIETVILNEQDSVSCPPLKGPNFGIDIDFVKGKSTNYESLDDLILSSSVSSSSELIQTYLSSSVFDTTNLNVQYYSGSNIDNGTILWENFVHFSSAKERVDNFVYKVQLIETYESAISASLSTGSNTATGIHTGSIAAVQEREKSLNKKRKIIQGFDGFESFLYESSSFGWPYSGSFRLPSSDTGSVAPWYETIIELAEVYDNMNYNYVLNNIPAYISDYSENESYLLFLSMIGHHFDNIYFYTKAIERSRGLGYKSKNGISDKLLYDTLKSFNWNALTLDSNAQLWKLVFGMDSDGNTKQTNPSKERTYEVWRRIVNNLPYLLKHKGTKRGIYALMACYGIPASNLSIIEFGGPEPTDLETNKSKFVYDNVTNTLIFNDGAYIEMPWKDTDKERRPDTIELFVKPSYANEWTLVTGSGDWNISLSGSANSSYGKVIFDYGTGVLQTSTLPIFNGSFFGVCLTREIGSPNDTFVLSVKQSNKERTIFEDSVTVSLSTGGHNYEDGSILRIGNNQSYSGSLDEFRLWSEPLDKDVFYQHVAFPEMLNGNSITASTSDLYFRLDFEYPKNLGVLPYFINVDTNIYYPTIQLTPSSSLKITRNILEETGSVNLNTDVLKSVNPNTIYSASAVGFNPFADFTIITAGSGYTGTTANVTITGGGASTNATATAYIDTNGSVSHLKLSTFGEGYTSSPTVVIDPPVSGIQATASLSLKSYPFNFEAIDRSIVLEMPNIGSSRYSTNKVRFESQQNFDGNDVSGGVDLSVKSRVTKKAFDQSPIDSNRVGLFFSPTKELNIDIAKSIGGFNLDNYIGDPSDKYKSNYKSLDDLRKYYFKRYDNRDIYQYINLIKLYEKSMFDDIKKMLPARVKATTGLLIEPHFLERSKIQQNKPTGSNDYNETELDTTENRLLSAETSDINLYIDTNDEYDLGGEDNQYETTLTDTKIEDVNADEYQNDVIINLDETNLISADNEYYETTLDAKSDEPTLQLESENQSFSTFGQDESSNLGFGIYSMNGHSIRSYYDSNGILRTERVIVYYLTEEKTKTYVTFKEFVDGVGDPRGGYNVTTIPYSETTLNIKPLEEIQVGDLITIPAIDLEDDEITIADSVLTEFVCDLILLDRQNGKLEFRYPQTTGTIYYADLLGIDNQNGAVAEGYDLDFITAPGGSTTYGGFPAVGGRITNVIRVDGYTKYHYKRVGDLTKGLQNSFYNGSKNTAATTLDGSPPVEVFVTNPNTLRVNKAGRDSNEPILEVE